MSISFLPELANKFSLLIKNFQIMRQTWTDERIIKMDYMDTLTRLRTVNEQFFTESGLWECPRDDNGQPMPTRVSVLAIGGGGGGANSMVLAGNPVVAGAGGSSSFGNLVTAAGGAGGYSDLASDGTNRNQMPNFFGNPPFLGAGSGGSARFFSGCGKPGVAASWHGMLDEDQTVVVGAGGPRAGYQSDFSNLYSSIGASGIVIVKWWQLFDEGL